MNRIAIYRPQTHHVVRLRETEQQASRMTEARPARRGRWATVGRSILAVAVVVAALAVLVLCVPAGLLFAILDGED